MHDDDDEDYYFLNIIYARVSKCLFHSPCT